MTEGQTRYQALMEEQRHNLEMERLGSIEAATKQKTAEANMIQADVAKKKQNLAERQHGWDIAGFFTNLLIPDANTALKAGAQVVSSIFG